MLKIIMLWLLFVPVPVINGILRENWYKEKLGELGTNIAGFTILSSIFLVYTFLFFKNQIAGFSTGKILLMGTLWLLFTLAFEFGIGFMAGHNLEYILADYNVIKGKFWPLILLAIFFSPFIVRAVCSKFNF